VDQRDLRGVGGAGRPDNRAIHNVSLASGGSRSRPLSG
jgi:hypothetical protein